MLCMTSSGKDSTGVQVGIMQVRSEKHREATKNLSSVWGDGPFDRQCKSDR